MAQPVWVLSVDLQTKTATFQSGMADAAKAARGSFNDIKAGADEMGRATGTSMTEARHGVMLLGEEFGVHLPRALTSFIASIGPVGAAMEAAFPFLAIIAGVTLLIEHLNKLHKAAGENADGWSKIGEEAADALEKTEREIKQVVNATEELTGGPLVALKHKLQDIDQQQFDNLLGNFKKVSDEIDKMLGGEQRGNIMSMLFGQNVEGELKEGFDKFRNAYSSFLQTGDTKLAAQALEDEIGGVGRKLEELRIASQNTTAPGLKEDLANVHALYNELINVAAFQENQQKLAADRKNYQTQSAENQNPEAFHPELFADAENQKRVSITQTIAAIQKEQEAANKADELQLLGVESLSKGLKELADERAKLAQEASKEDAGHGMRMAELQLEADKETGRMRMAQARMTAQEIAEMDVSFAEREYKAKQDSLNQEISALDTGAKDYENKLKALQDKELELVRTHENQITQIEDKAEEERNSRILSAVKRRDDEIARGMTSMLMRHESAAKMMISLGDQMAAGMIENAIKSMLADDMTKERDAAAAARKAFLAGENSVPGWPGVILGGALAAGAFATVMAFEAGGVVPGVGAGDTVPAMLTPGEGVIPKGVMDHLDHAAKFGSGSDSGGNVHVHHTAHYHISAIDGASVKGMLEKHSDTFTQHFHNQMRKLNR